MTERHRAGAVASRAIELALRGEPFQVSDVRRRLTDPPSRQTVYRVLAQLERDEWVRQDGKTWHPDFKAQALGHVDDTGGGAHGETGIDVHDILEG